MRMSGRTPRRELLLFPIPYSLSLPKSGANSIFLNTLPNLGGGGPKLSAHSCKLTADRSKSLCRCTISPALAYSLLPLAYSLSLPKSGVNSIFLNTLPNLGEGATGAIQPASRLVRLRFGRLPQKSPHADATSEIRAKSAAKHPFPSHERSARAVIPPETRDRCSEPLRPPHPTQFVR